MESFVSFNEDSDPENPSFGLFHVDSMEKLQNHFDVEENFFSHEQKFPLLGRLVKSPLQDLAVDKKPDNEVIVLKKHEFSVARFLKRNLLCMLPEYFFSFIGCLCLCIPFCFMALPFCLFNLLVDLFNKILKLTTRQEQEQQQQSAE